jgi:hypothetical protein
MHTVSSSSRLPDIGVSARAWSSNGESKWYVPRRIALGGDIENGFSFFAASVSQHPGCWQRALTHSIGNFIGGCAWRRFSPARLRADEPFALAAPAQRAGARAAQRGKGVIDSIAALREDG